MSLAPSRSGRALLLLFAIAPLARPAQAGSAPLTIDRAVARALAHNERARTADLDRAAAAARVSRARSFFLPDLTASGTYTRRAREIVRVVGGDEVTIQSRNALSGNLTATLTLFDARGFPLYRQATLAREAAELRAAEEKRLLAFETADAFLQTLGHEQVLQAAERRLEFARASRADARARVGAGLAGSNDLTRADLEITTAQRELHIARGTLAEAYLQLGFLIDAPVEGRLSRPESLLAAAVAPLPERDPRALSARAVARRFDLRAFRREAEAARAAAEEPARRFLPSLGLLGQYRGTNEAGFAGRHTDWFLAATLTWTLWDGGERAAEERERAAIASAAELAAAAGERRTATDVSSAVVELETAQGTLAEARRAVAAARKNVEESAALYRQGLGRALEVADANVRLFEAEVALARAEYGLALAYLGLRAALGLSPLGKDAP